MSASAVFWSRSYPIGRGFVALFESPKPEQGQVGALTVEWWPRRPRKLSPQLQVAYAAARERFLVELCDRAGLVGDVAVLGIDRCASR